MALGPSRGNPSSFYDGGTEDEPPRPDRPPKVMLERVEVRAHDGAGRERFRMLRRIAYLDDVYGEILVPANPDTFRTDFASVPALFTWLVPRTGAHLPAALIHDGLVSSGDGPAYIATRYPGAAPIDRVAADVVLRRAMRDSYVGPIRRWLVWSAVTLGTIWTGSSAWSRAQHLRYLLTAAATLLVIAGLGVVATLDLFDILAWIPWMGADRGFVVELVGGLAGAIVIPLVLGLAWGRFAIAGAVTGIALAVLLHVTVLLLALTLLYQVAEWVARRRPVAGLVAAGIVISACLLLTLLLVAGWTGPSTV